MAMTGDDERFGQYYSYLSQMASQGIPPGSAGVPPPISPAGFGYVAPTDGPEYGGYMRSGGIGVGVNGEPVHYAPYGYHPAMIGAADNGVSLSYTSSDVLPPAAMMVVSPAHSAQRSLNPSDLLPRAITRGSSGSELPPEDGHRSLNHSYSVSPALSSTEHSTTANKYKQGSWSAVDQSTASTVAGSAPLAQSASTGSSMPASSAATLTVPTSAAMAGRVNSDPTSSPASISPSTSVRELPSDAASTEPQPTDNALAAALARVNLQHSPQRHPHMTPGVGLPQGYAVYMVPSPLQGSRVLSTGAGAVPGGDAAYVHIDPQGRGGAYYPVPAAAAYVNPYAAPGPPHYYVPTGPNQGLPRGQSHGLNNHRGVSSGSGSGATGPHQSNRQQGANGPHPRSFGPDAGDHSYMYAPHYNQHLHAAGGAPYGAVPYHPMQYGYVNPTGVHVSSHHGHQHPSGGSGQQVPMLQLHAPRVTLNQLPNSTGAPPPGSSSNSAAPPPAETKSS